MTYFEHTHYYRTPAEQDAMSGKGSGCYDHDAALCGNGSFHFKRSRNIKKVTCEKCLNLLKRGSQK